MTTTEVPCVVRVDRVQIVAQGKVRQKPPELAGFKVTRDCFVRSQTTIKTYARCRHYWSTTSKARIYWQYCRQVGWLQPWKITLVADDRRGLSRTDIELPLKYCRRHRLILVELAFDFAPNSGVTGQFLRRFGRFGKSRGRDAR
jgi:hypothetical protein